MQIKKKYSGFMLLNALLGIFLLSGVIYLIMHTMTKYHTEQNADAIGQELAPIVTALLVNDPNNLKEGTYSLVTTSASACGGGAPVVKNIAPGYLESLKASGFDLASSACVDVTG